MDISMCRNNDCVKKNKCLRYMGKPGYVQAYGAFAPEINKLHNFKCEYFWFINRKGQSDTR